MAFYAKRPASKKAREAKANFGQPTLYKAGPDGRVGSLVQAADKSALVQKQAALQRMASGTTQRKKGEGTQGAGGGLPENLRQGLETLGGVDMSDVRVNRNSGRPAELGAHATAQGSNIDIAPGQEKTLPHEAWHVVQQKQGRVRPTTQLKGVAINDDPELEKEADQMGSQAAQLQSQQDQEASED